jgi:hypothetical protein
MIAASFSEHVQSALRDFSHWVGSITTLGWALLAAAAIAILWVVSALRAQTRLGPIEIAALEYDTKVSPSPAAPSLLALTAEFRKRLWMLGLTPPPLVPDGAPQADLITAVGEVSPQAKIVASFLKLLPGPPRPARFKVTSTLGDAANGTVTGCGVSFMLQSFNGAPPYLNAVSAVNHSAALQHAAALVYRQITMSTPEVFPLWVRWRTVEALDAYVDGRDLAENGDLTSAIEKLEEAIRESPFNALAQMQLGNVYEQCAGAHNSAWDVAYFQALALRRYLETAHMWPKLVETRYRASVVGAALAYSYAQLTDAKKEAIHRMVPVEHGAPVAASGPFAERRTRRRTARTAFAARLRTLVERESAATIQMLRLTYTFWWERRLRNQFEPKGVARRRLSHTARISRHCLGMRALNARPDEERALRRWRLKVQARQVRVHGVHLGLGKANITWQARYNAACFDALLLSGSYYDGHEGRRARAEKRSLRNLDDALREAAGELPQAWVENDPDLEVFH